MAMLEGGRRRVRGRDGSEAEKDTGARRRSTPPPSHRTPGASSSSKCPPEDAAEVPWALTRAVRGRQAWCCGCRLLQSTCCHGLSTQELRLRGPHFQVCTGLAPLLEEWTVSRTRVSRDCSLCCVNDFLMMATPGHPPVIFLTNSPRVHLCWWSWRAIRAQ